MQFVKILLIILVTLKGYGIENNTAVQQNSINSNSTIAADDAVEFQWAANSNVSVIDDISYQEFNINFRISSATFDNQLALFRRNLISVPSVSWREQWQSIQQIEYILTTQTPVLTPSQMQYLDLLPSHISSQAETNLSSSQSSENPLSSSNQTNSSLEISFSVVYLALETKRRALKDDIDAYTNREKVRNQSFAANWKELTIELKRIRKFSEILLLSSDVTSILLEDVHFNLINKLERLRFEYDTLLSALQVDGPVSQRQIWLTHKKLEEWSIVVSEIIQTHPNIEIPEA